MRLEKKATVVSTTVAATLVTIKMTIGVLSGSIAVLASAIDSFLDLSISAFNYFALHNAEKAPDDRFNYGRSKLEPLATVIEGTIISISGLFILYEALTKIIHQRTTGYLGESIAVMVVSMVITGALVLFLNHVSKKTGNMVIQADALHYKTDLYSNAAVLLALVLMQFTGEELIDPVLGIGIAAYMIYSAFPLIKEGVLMLLDAALEPEEVDKIEYLIKRDPSITDYHDLRTRRSGSEIYIAVHLVFGMEYSLYEAHKVSDRIEEGFDRLFPDDKVHSIVHLDPYDDSDLNH